MKDEVTFSLSYEQLLQETEEEIKRLVNDNWKGTRGFLSRWEQASGVQTFFTVLAAKCTDGTDKAQQLRVREDEIRLQRLLDFRPRGQL
ncbi:hypothetical protein [Enterobacter sp. R4-368]|uniref:hypothetical protein n=1 Tax=Enterobacter sp. R4-368 TaxID=1166130 RepID=UPI00034F0F02|nr:hypothetical protein [Enterobacter sp. R4-368]AGN88266.1 hypothetical protein H650_00155 [Enterobacter sp. R4-368]